MLNKTLSSLTYNIYKYIFCVLSVQTLLIYIFNSLISLLLYIDTEF